MKVSKDEKLILGIEKPIWLAVDVEPEYKVKGWTPIKPPHDNGFIDKGSVLIFDHLYAPEEGEVGLNFIQIMPGPKEETKTAEFFQREIDIFVKEGVMTLLNVEEIHEISIFNEYIFIKYPGRSSFDARVFSPKESYVIMTTEESEKSSYKLGHGEKITLRDLIDMFLTSATEYLPRTRK